MKPHSTGSSGAHPQLHYQAQPSWFQWAFSRHQRVSFLAQDPKASIHQGLLQVPEESILGASLPWVREGQWEVGHGGPFIHSWNLVTLGSVPRRMESFPHHCPTPTQASTFLPMSTAVLARFPSPFPTSKPTATSSHNAIDNTFFKALLEPATIKKLPLPSLFCHFSSSGPADPGHHKLEAILSRSKRSSGTALFHTSLGYNCSTPLATLSAPYIPVLASTTSHVDKSVVGTQ